MDDLNKINLSERILLLRRKKGFSQREVARALNISPTNIMNYEKGIHTPSVDVAVKLAQLLNISLDFLILGKEAAHIHDNELAEQFLKADKLPNTDRAKLKNTIQGFLLS